MAFIHAKQLNKLLKLDKLKTYYETHDTTNEAMAKLFNIPLSTLTHYISEYEWKKGVGLENIDLKDIQNEIKKGTNLKVIKETIKEKLSTEGNIKKIYEEQALNNSCDDILIKAMTQGFIDSKITETSLLAKNSFDCIANEANNRNDHALLIKLAKDLIFIFTEMKKALYGKQSDTLINVINSNSNFANPAELSDDELKTILLQKQKANIGINENESKENKSKENESKENKSKIENQNILDYEG